MDISDDEHEPKQERDGDKSGDEGGDGAKGMIHDIEMNKPPIIRRRSNVGSSSFNEGKLYNYLNKQLSR